MRFCIVYRVVQKQPGASGYEYYTEFLRDKDGAVRLIDPKTADKVLQDMPGTGWAVTIANRES